jgi:hypothetical protein
VPRFPTPLCYVLCNYFIKHPGVPRFPTPLCYVIAKVRGEHYLRRNNSLSSSFAAWIWRLGSHPAELSLGYVPTPPEGTSSDWMQSPLSAVMVRAWPLRVTVPDEATYSTVREGMEAELGAVTNWSTYLSDIGVPSNPNPL